MVPGHATPAPGTPGGPPAPTPAGQGAPTVVQVAPSQLNAGGTYTLALAGSGFQSGMQVDFGPGITVTKQPAVSDAGHAQVAVQVLAATSPGHHIVTTTFARAGTFAAATTQKTEGPGYVDVVAPAASGGVLLDLLAPREVQQGQRTTLTLEGAGFATGMTVSFGPGIAAAGPVIVQNSKRASLAISVAAQAPTILRHPTLVLSGHDVRVSPEATLTVTAGAARSPPVPAPVISEIAPVVLAIAPARIYAGQKYTLTLRGMNLVPQLQASLGPGITASGGLRVESASLATLDVAVADNADPGLRWLGLQLPAAPAPVREDASVLVERASLVPVHALAPRPSECKPPAVAHQGSVVLDGPLYTGSMSDVGGTFNVPVLNNSTTLSWHEANQGLAERYELRFYSGSTLVAKRSLGAPPGYALPHSLTPDAGLIDELTQKVGGRASKLVNVHTAPGSVPGSLTWDLTWQVVGLRSFYDSCASPSAVVGEQAKLMISRQALGQAKELEVEHSESVPVKQPQTGDPLLDLPAAPTGLACDGSTPSTRRIKTRPGGSGGSASAPKQQLLLANVSRATQGGRTATADYVGDRWQYSGKFDLSDAPWAIESQHSVSTSNPQHPLETQTLQNVFVDWGDGTIEPLTIQWPGQYCGGQVCFASNTETSTATSFNLDLATNPGAFGHAYAEVGSFDVRVYMMPSSAVQPQGVLPISMHAGTGGLYGRLMSKAGLAPSGNSSGDLAFMLTCQTVNIQHRTDPVSNGPLELVAVRITGFPDAPASAKLGGPIRAAARPGEPPAPPPQQSPVRAATRIGFPGRPGSSGGEALPQFSSCDVNLIGGASIDFRGQGTVRLTWYQDGKPVGSREEPLGPSQARTDAQLAPPRPAAPITSTWGGFHSPPLSLQQIGQHQLSVEAEVVADAHPLTRVVGALGAFGKPSGSAAASPAMTASSIGPAPPLGLLAPRGAASAGLAPILWVNQAPAAAPGLSLHLEPTLHVGVDLHGGSDPPNEVISGPAGYETTSADPSLPCTFNFPVAGGKYVLAGLQHGGTATVKQQGGSYSGTGTLQAQFADASGTSTQPDPIPIHLKGWTMQGDGVTVASGSFDESPTPAPLRVPGLTALLERIAGTAGQSVSATLTASLANTDIYSTGGALPSPWRHVSAVLSPQGDWYADQLPLPSLLLYDSGFVVNAANVTLDLSQAQGQGADPACQGAGGKAWMGVMLNQAKLTAFNFDLPSPPTIAASGWALDSYGFCGKANFPSGSATLDRGSIGWSGIAATASQGRFSASYNNLKVHVPWLNIDLSSPQAVTQLTAGRGAGQGGITLNLTQPAMVTLTEGPITLKASNLSFSSVPSAGGWAVKSDTSFSFTSQQGQFASGLVLHGFDYGMSGAASFADGTSERHLSLAGQKGTIGGSVVDLKSVDVTVNPASSPTRVAFAFDSTLTLSKTLPSADVAVGYSIEEPSSGNYAGAGPVTAPFKLDKPFPDANPSVHLSMTPTYVGGSSRAQSGVIFSSSLDLGMFGGPPVSGQFVLGYVGTDDYWLAKAVLDLGPTGVTLVPPVINLYQVGGGMGYNVTLDSFKNPDLSQATPKDDNTLLFDASLLVGSPDHTTFGLLGDFVIKPGGADPGGRMDYHAWLLDPNWSGQSPIWGYFSYSGGVFDGTLNAQLSLLDGQVGLSALNDAIHMHVGGGQWYYHFGTESNPLNGHLFFENGQAWADLGSDGFSLGLIAHLDLDAGDCGGACAYVHDDWKVTAGITPSPLSISASASESFNVGACADNFCLNANASAAVSLSLPPPYLNFSFGLGGCPPGQINVGLQVLPTLSPSVSGSVCL
jgi:hypothetical protein